MTSSQAQRFAQEISQYKGQWILVEDSRVVAASPSIKKAINSLKPAQRRKVVAQYVPEEDCSGAIFSAY